MADLDAETALEGEGQRFIRRLEPAWYVDSVFGGYLAAIAVRAAERSSDKPRVVSAELAFLRRVTPDAELVVDTRVLRSSRRADCVEITMEAGGEACVQGRVWTSAPEGPGYTHERGREVPPEPESWPGPGLVFGGRLEMRPDEWIDDWIGRPRRDPRFEAWFRTVPAVPKPTGYLDACRALIVADYAPTLVAHRSHPHAEACHHTTLSLSVAFHTAQIASEWLFCEAESIAADGLVVSGRGTIYDRTGTPVASVLQQNVISRPQPT